MRTKTANLPYKNILLFLIAFLLFFPSLLHAQTLDEIQTLLKTQFISYAQAARFVLEAADVKVSYDKTSEQGAMSFAIEKKWLPQKANAQDAITLEDFSLLVMKAFGLNGGLMYVFFNNAHYSYREMVFQDFIQGESDPQMKVSGRDMIFIVNRILYQIEDNPWELPSQTEKMPVKLPENGQ